MSGNSTPVFISEPIEWQLYLQFFRSRSAAVGAPPSIGFGPPPFFLRFAASSRGGLPAEYLLDSKADAVIWFSPDRTCRETVATLRDAGVWLIGVRDGGLPSIPSRNEICGENALHTILRSNIR
jgi:hypothetical protein